MKIISILLCLILSAFADDIYLKSGKVIKNVQIIEIKSDYIIARTTDGKEYNFVFENILKIDKKEFDPNMGTKIEGFDKFNTPGTYEFDLELKKDTKKIYPYIKLLPVTALCWLLSWDYLKRSSDLKDEIKDLQGLDTSALESAKTRCDIIGYSMIGLGILNLSFSIQSVEVKIVDNQLYLSYNF